MIRILREMVGYMRGERPEPLPDPVLWVVTIPRDRMTEYLDKAEEEGWPEVSDPIYPLGDSDSVTLKFRRTDGKYRWRDVGFRGF